MITLTAISIVGKIGNIPEGNIAFIGSALGGLQFGLLAKARVASLNSSDLRLLCSRINDAIERGLVDPEAKVLCKSSLAEIDFSRLTVSDLKTCYEGKTLRLHFLNGMNHLRGDGLVPVQERAAA